MELHYQFTKYAQKGHIVNFCFVFVMFVVSIVGKIWRTEQCLTWVLVSNSVGMVYVACIAKRNSKRN